MRNGLQFFRKRTFLGMPMRWNRRRIFWNYWDPREERIFLPKNFGIGWDLNFHALCRKIGLIKDDDQDSSVSGDGEAT